MRFAFSVLIVLPFFASNLFATPNASKVKRETIQSKDSAKTSMPGAIVSPGGLQYSPGGLQAGERPERPTLVGRRSADVARVGRGSASRDFRKIDRRQLGRSESAARGRRAGASRSAGATRAQRPAQRRQASRPAPSRRNGR